MNISLQNEPEIREPKYDESLTANAKAETTEQTGMPVKDQDTMLGMIVLLLTCLALAALAHVFV